MKFFVILCLIFTLNNSLFAHDKTTIENLLKHADVPVYNYEVIRTYPHDTSSYTEGLTLENGNLYESTGLFFHSRLRCIDLTTGKILKEYILPARYFGEGITILQNQIFQLTYENKEGFVYDKNTFHLIKTINFPKFGWGLANNGKELIMSDGSSSLTFIDPLTLKQIREIQVTDQKQAILMLNELEYIHGKIYANIWLQDYIAIISPIDGKVEGWINLKGLNPDPAKLKGDFVLNGIAYDDANQHILITGKDWPFIYAIKLHKS